MVNNTSETRVRATGRYRQGEGRHVRQQVMLGLPEVRQGHRVGHTEKDGKKKFAVCKKCGGRSFRKE